MIEREGVAPAATVTPAEKAKPAETIGEVIARMEAIKASLRPDDGVGYFNELYLKVTQAVQQGVQELVFVSDPPFITHLDVVFANRYFEAFDGWAARQQCDAAWRPLFEAREHKHHPIQFALCGMNAHICFDLQVAVADLLVKHDAKPHSDSPQHTDFARVNDVLRKVEPEVKDWFFSKFAADLDRATHELPDSLAMFCIADERALAWRHGRELWRLRGHHDLEHRFLELRGDVSEIEGRAFLV
jgi:hypothetical protein